ncbi:ribokinase [Spirochaetia bacterium]|nr:ribokinase [Spirochaetia bacterium]
MKGRNFDVLAIGELNVDLIFTGLKQAPALNREIAAEKYSRALGSSTALCGANLAKLGLGVAFCTKVGDDENGHYVVDELQKRGIDTTHCKIDPASETGVTLALNWNRDRALVTVMGTISTFSLADFDIEILRSARHIHVGSFFLQEALRKDLPLIFEKAHEWGITTSLDSGWDDTGVWDYGIKDTLKNTSLFFPNETEALHITGASSCEDAAKELSGLCKTIVIKRGNKGAYALSGNSWYSVDVMADIPVVDTTGAGDSFNAGFLYAFLKGLPLTRCIEYGNACGSISVMTIGGANADLNEDKVKALIGSHLRAESGNC